MEFFDYINERLDSESEIFYIGVDYYKYLFSAREFTAIGDNAKHLALPKDSYFLLTYIDYKNDYICDDLLIYLSNNADLVFKRNFYEIYRIK